MPQTPYEYYTDEDNYGQYQYFKFSEIIDELLLETHDDDSILKNTKRSKIIDTARRGIRDLAKDVANDFHAFEITISPSLWIPLPQDYVNWVRVSVAKIDPDTKSYRLYPLDINYSIDTAISYLQDHQHQILFDSDGDILQAEGVNAIAFPYKSYTFGCGFNPMVNAAKYSEHGEFTIDERRGKMVFSSDLVDANVVIEYVSDGLESDLSDDEITVHKHLRQALRDFVISECVATKRNVSISDKHYWRNRWLASRHRAKLTRADFDMLRISRIMRVRTKAL